MTELKEIKTDKYYIKFNPKTGQEMLTGINDYPDPFSLEYPSLMDIGIMGHCNNNCKICYQGDVVKPNMTLENFRRIIDESKDHITQVALGGKGDPNLHEKFKEIVEYCRLNNVVPNYTTSGNGLTEDQVKISKEFCGAVAISSYDKDFTFDAINLFLKHKFKTNIHFVVSSETVGRAINIIQGIDVWNNKFDLSKINAIIFLLFKPQGNGKDLKNLILSDSDVKLFREELKKKISPVINLKTREDFYKFFDWYKKERTTFKIGIDSCFACRIASVCNDFTDQEKVFVDTCEGARMSCYVTSDMKFMPCSFGDKKDYGVPIDTNDPKSIQKIWDNGEPFIKFRNILQEKSDRCPYDFENEI